MKTLLTLSLTLLSLVTFAQAASTKPLTAEFKYNDASIQDAISKNKVQFVLQNISNSIQLDRFAETSQYYKNDFLVIITPGDSNGGKVCLVNFLNNKTNMGELIRLFSSNGIEEVTYDSKKMPTATFFAKFNAANTAK